MTFYCHPPRHWAKRFGSEIEKGIQRLFPVVDETYELGQNVDEGSKG